MAPDLRRVVACVAQASGLCMREVERFLFGDSMTGLFTHSAPKDYLVREIARGVTRGRGNLLRDHQYRSFQASHDTYRHAIVAVAIIAQERGLTWTPPETGVLNDLGFLYLIAPIVIDMPRWCIYLPYQ